MPSRARIITATVVASALVSDDRSYTVSILAGERLGSIDLNPNAPSNATSAPRRTTTVAPGITPLLDRVVESLLDLTPSQRPILRKTCRYRVTAGSVKMIRRAAESIRATTPNGIVKFSVPCPASTPYSTGHPRPAVCSAAKRAIIRVSCSLPSIARIAPKTIPATRPSAPDWRNCTSIRSIR